MDHPTPGAALFAANIPGRLSSSGEESRPVILMLFTSLWRCSDTSCSDDASVCKA